MSVAESSATPCCPHFGTCGGCQYQDLAYSEQLRLKRTQLEGLFQQAALEIPGPITIYSAEPYGYRNRIRLRLERVDGDLRFGYNIRTTTEFLPITTCPISAPVLIETAEALLAAAKSDRDAEYWLSATAEVELFANDDLTRVQVTLFCAPRTKVLPGSFDRMLSALQAHAPQVVGASAMAFDQRTGPTGRRLAEAGASGLNYRVLLEGEPAEAYWITRGGFFQVNRFLLHTLVQLVCFEDGQSRSGTLAWDLFAGVGLFSRILVRSFDRITAVEANPTAATDLRSAFNKLSPGSNAIEATTLDFLRRAAVERDRPEFIVLDPPRAGAGLEACELLNRIGAPAMAYVSCDPSTLARDLQALEARYRISAIHLVDLFPQTAHLETVAILRLRT